MYSLYCIFYIHNRDLPAASVENCLYRMVHFGFMKPKPNKLLFFHASLIRIIFRNVRISINKPVVAAEVCGSNCCVLHRPTSLVSSRNHQFIVFQSNLIQLV